jgi:DNA polymerase-1
MVARERRERGAVKILGLDTETFPIKPARQAPRIVCVQTRDDAGSRVELRDRGLDRLEAALADRAILIVGHDVAYDALASIATRPRLLLPWLDAYEADRVVCTHVRESLARIAEGSSDRHRDRSLLGCVERYKILHAFEAGDKVKGSVRLRFHEVDGIPVSQWPEGFERYALADLVAVDVHEAQRAAFSPAWFQDQFRRSRADFWLRVTSAHGMRVDARAVARFAALVEEEHRTCLAILADADEEALRRFSEDHDLERVDAIAPVRGLVRYEGTRDLKAARARMESVCLARALPVPVTATGREKGLDVGAGAYVALDADACAASGDLQLRAYARFTSIGTLRSRADRLALAARLGVPVQPRFDPLKKTGRTSCSKGESTPGEPLNAVGDQTQNLNREPGLRECYIARPGCVILSADWKAAELHTLAQTCADWGLDSALARVLREKDAHVWFGAISQGWTYEWTIEALRGDHGPDAKKKAKAARQGAKACNFGFPGGLGIAKFRAWAAKTYGVIWTEAEASRRKAQWLDAFPEMYGYFRIVDRVVNSGAPLEHPRSGRFRGDLTFTSAANSPFQGRCADMLVDAGWRSMSWIYRNGIPARTWNEAHDEILFEIREDRAHEIATEITRIMDDVGREWCPIAPCRAEPALQRHWRKGAEPAYRAGRLIPHEDRDLGAEDLESIRKALASGVDALRVSWTYGIEESRVNAIERGGR